MSAATDPQRLAEAMTARWSTDLPAAIAQLVSIPSVSPAFDTDWKRHGHLQAAVDDVAARLRAMLPDDCHMLPLALPGRSPLLVCEIPATTAVGTTPTVLVYGHLDKQPGGPGWRHTEPFVPLRRASELIGRGAADDGYAPYLLAAVVQEMRARALPYPRIVLLLETSEESSSVDLPAYLDMLGSQAPLEGTHGDLLADPELVICLDAFVPDNDRLWTTTSMRGIIVADLGVSVLARGVHSGIAGGVVPSSFRILRMLLDRVEDAATGRLLLPELQMELPAEHRALLERQATITGGPPSEHLPLLPGLQPATDSALEQLIAQCWQPSLSYVGVGGMPPLDAAGSVLRAQTAVRLSLRLPPTCDAAAAAGALADVLEADPPYEATVQFQLVAAQDGWVGRIPQPLRTALRAASQVGYSVDDAYCGSGATIPFMGMLAERYPAATMLPFGVLGPGSNPHGPDETLDLLAARKLSLTLATLLAAIVEAEGRPS